MMREAILVDEYLYQPLHHDIHLFVDSNNWSRHCSACQQPCSQSFQPPLIGFSVGQSRQHRVRALVQLIHAVGALGARQPGTACIDNRHVSLKQSLAT